MVVVDVVDIDVVVVADLVLLLVPVEHLLVWRSGRKIAALVVFVHCTLGWCNGYAVVCLCLCPCCCSVVVFVVVRAARASRMMSVVMMLVDFVGINMLVVSNCGGY